jgi:formate hydrogenlyase subunit 4
LDADHLVVGGEDVLAPPVQLVVIVMLGVLVAAVFVSVKGYSSGHTRKRIGKLRSLKLAVDASGAMPACEK